MSYAMFAVAILLTLLKLGGIVGVTPLFLKLVPGANLAEAVAAPVAQKAPYGELLDLPYSGTLAPEPIGSLLAITSGVTGSPVGGDREGAGGPSRDEAPVFYRPSSEETREPGDRQVCGNLGDFPKSSRAVFPLPGTYFDSYDNTWGAARPQGGHEGSDLMSPTGTPEFAITDGTIVPVRRSNENGWNRLGGYTVMLQAAYDAGPIKKGDLFYYAHMDEKSALPVGTQVRAGQQIGLVGDTGEGREGTRGKFPPHLHLGWYDTGSAGSRTNAESGAMNPYPLLLWLEQNGGSITGGTNASYCEAPQAPAPSSTSADLDTGYQDDARPSPVVGYSQETHGHPTGQEFVEENVSDEGNQPNETEPPLVENEVPSEGPDAGLASGSGREGTEEERSEPTAPDQSELMPGARQAHPPSAEAAPPSATIQDKVRFPLPAPSQSGQVADMPGAPALANSPEETGQDGDKADKEKQKDKEKDAEPPKREGEEKEPRCAAPGGEARTGRNNVYITRARDRTDGWQMPINNDEWLEAIENDPEMRVRGAVEATSGAGEKIRYENQGLTVWKGHPVCKRVWFDLRDGNVVVEDPDRITLEKMQYIAGKLGAKVRGDDGKEY